MALSSSWRARIERLESHGAKTRALAASALVPKVFAGISDIYFDPVNGNDNNQGIYTSTPATPAPLRTGQELARRWGANAVFTSSLDDGFGFKVTRLHILNDITGANMLDLDAIPGDDLSYLQILGENTIALRSGVLDAAGGFTAWNPTGAGGGSATVIRDSTLASWTPFIGKRVFFPRINSWAYVLKNLGGGAARISPPQFGDPSIGNVPLNQFPANGDVYRVERPVTLNLNRTDMRAFAEWENLTIQVPSIFANNLLLKNDYVAQQLFFQCVLECFYMNGPGAQFVTFTNCCAQGITEPTNSGGLNGGLGWYGGALVNPTGPTAAILTGGLGDAGVIDYYTALQGGPAIIHGDTNIRSFSVWDVPVSSDNPNGHAILVGTPGHHTTGGNVRLAARGVIPIFGNGSLGVGLWVGEDSNVIWETVGGAPPNVFGASGQFKLGTGGKARFFDETTGLPSGVLPETWIALAAAQPGGFGGFAHNFSENANLLQAISG